ncbi:hypothetical protein E2C01_044691 [Portunus trituberculatus]|uniref:Uncharacterized protein n=1 Tax=Portunus trituberculatus TaxID=210409 RepID=A0A5B7FZV1_PORTR|nr:hypothetical protein [Portunus trituberculatus]
MAVGVIPTPRRPVGSPCVPIYPDYPCFVWSSLNTVDLCPPHKLLQARRNEKVQAVPRTPSHSD